MINKNKLMGYIIISKKDQKWINKFFHNEEDANNEIKDKKSEYVYQYKGWALECSKCGTIIPPEEMWKYTSNKKSLEAKNHFEKHGENIDFVKVINIK